MAATTEKDWGMDATVARLRRAATDDKPAPTDGYDGSFRAADGTLIGRHGPWVVVGDRAYHLGGATLARYFFRRLTEAAL